VSWPILALARKLCHVASLVAADRTEIAPLWKLAASRRVKVPKNVTTSPDYKPQAIDFSLRIRLTGSHVTFI
jgi:hypothetical protein